MNLKPTFLIANEHARELAGTVIRCMDIAERFDLRLAEAIVEEIKANAERGFRHGGKAA